MVGKNIMPLYNEVANIPCFIWHPQHGCAGESRQALAQTIDIPATLLDSFGLPKPQDMQGYLYCRYCVMTRRSEITRCLAIMAATSILPMAATSICAPQSLKV